MNVDLKKKKTDPDFRVKKQNPDPRPSFYEEKLGATLLGFAHTHRLLIFRALAPCVRSSYVSNCVRDGTAALKIRIDRQLWFLTAIL